MKIYQWTCPKCGTKTQEGTKVHALLFRRNHRKWHLDNSKYKPLPSVKFIDEIVIIY